jgi:hypothetical protein
MISLLLGVVVVLGVLGIAAAAKTARWQGALARTVDDLHKDVAFTLRGLEERIIGRLVERTTLVPLPAFVSLVVVGRAENGDPCVCGTSLVLTDRKSQGELRLQAQMPMRAAYAVVLCDQARVGVGGIFRGVDLRQQGLGDCPMAVIGDWQPGVIVRALVELRELS